MRSPKFGGCTQEGIGVPRVESDVALAATVFCHSYSEWKGYLGNGERDRERSIFWNRNSFSGQRDLFSL